MYRPQQHKFAPLCVGSCSTHFNTSLVVGQDWPRVQRQRPDPALARWGRHLPPLHRPRCRRRSTPLLPRARRRPEQRTRLPSPKPSLTGNRNRSSKLMYGASASTTLLAGLRTHALLWVLHALSCFFSISVRDFESCHLCPRSSPAHQKRKMPSGEGGGRGGRFRQRQRCIVSVWDASFLGLCL